MRGLLAQILVIVLASSPALAGSPREWQQRVAYTIDASLDTAEHYLHATERVRYWNNSPDTLHVVWFHLYPNAYKDLNTALARDAIRYHDFRGRSIPERDRGFIDVQSLRIGNRVLTLSYGDDATSAKVDLPSPLAPGDSIVFDLSFQVKLPKIVSRLGHDQAHYEISQWYPKIVVYDEKGWHPDGYHYLGEFYGDYGEFDVSITAPKAMKIGATGVLQAARDTTDVALGAARAAPDTVRAVPTPEDALLHSRSLPGGGADGKSTWRFRALQVHDFAWCADSTYRDTTEMHQGVAIRVLTLPRHKQKWGHVLQYAKDALDYYGRWYGAYPYSTLTVCDGSLEAGGGMEYPNLVIISTGEDVYSRSLELVVMHEIGHQWFYGVLGNNEMDEAWLDEGINSFSEQRYLEEKYGSTGNMLAKPFLQRLLPEFTDRYYGRLAYSIVADNRMEQPVLTRASASRDLVAYGIAAYMKPALMMWWLREYLGHEQFDSVMQAYFRRYRFRHVSTERFFSVVDSVTHRDVRPYCLPWLTTTDRCDYEIDKVARVPDQANAYRVVCKRNEKLVFPVSLQLEDKAKKQYQVNWSGVGADTTFIVRTEAGLSRAVLDPAADVPDLDEFNNFWPRRCSVTMRPHLPSPDRYQISWLPVPWFDSVNGLRLGPYLHGGYGLDVGPMMGRHQWTLWPYWSLKTKEASFSFSYRTPVTHRPMPPRVYVSLSHAFDVESASLGLRRSWGESLLSPNRRFDVHLDYSRVRAVERFWDSRDIEKGTNVMLTAERGWTHYADPVVSRLRIASSVGTVTEPEGPGRDFVRWEIEEKVSTWIGEFVRPRVRVFVGQITGSVPAQEQYFLSGGSKTAGFEDLIVARRGAWSAQEHYHVEGGADLPGYLGRHIRGKVVSSVNLSLPVPRAPVTLFCGAGQVTNCWPQWRGKDLTADAGIRLNAGFASLIAPLWINRPSPGERRFDWRWQVSIGGAIRLSP